MDLPTVEEGVDPPPFPKIEAPPQHPNPRSRQTSTSSDTRLRSGSLVVGGGDQFVEIDETQPVMPLGSVVPAVGRRPNPQVVRLIESEPAPPIGGFLPANDSHTQLTPSAEEEGSGSGRSSGAKRNKNNSESLNSDDDEGIAVKVPLTSSSGSTDDAEIQLEELEPSRGLSKAELMQYVDDPYWKKIRMLLFLAFWVMWLSMVVAAGVILGISPKCPTVPKLGWWQKTPIYRLKPHVYFDSNGDGVGDLQGLTKKLEYIDGLHAKAVLVDDVFQSANFKDVDERLGTLLDLENLVKAAHKKGMFIVLDLDPTTVVEPHPWFQASRRSKSPSDFYRDFFVWADASSSSSPPSALTLSDGSSAWSFDSVRGQFYLRSSDSGSPVVNLANDAVKREIEDSFDYWLSKGIDGFSLRGLQQLLHFEDAVEGVVGESLPRQLNATAGGVAAIVAGWKAIFESHRERTHRERLLMLDASFSSSSIDFSILEGSEMGVDVVMRADVVEKMRRLPAGVDHCDSRCLKSAVDTPHEDVVVASADAEESGSKTKWRAEAIGGESVPRFVERVGRERFNAYFLVLGLLPGTPVIYYGDEIGMLQPADNVTATPMQWTSDSKTGGFTTSKKGPFVPFAPLHERHNVQVQRALGADHNNLEVVEHVLKLRKEPSFTWGKIFESSRNNQIYSYVRQAEGFPGYLVAVNVGASPSIIDFVKPSLRLPVVGEIVMTTKNLDHKEFDEGSSLRLDKVFLRPGEGVVVRLDENVVRDDVVVNGH